MEDELKNDETEVKEETPEVAEESQDQPEKLPKKTGELSEEAAEMLEESEDDDSKYPFPMAAVVRRIKAKSSGQMISSKVKVATNNFLGYIADKASEEMATTRYSTIEMDDFQRATQPFFAAQELEAEKARVIAHLEKMRADIEMLIREFEQKFGMENVERRFI